MEKILIDGTLWAKSRCSVEWRCSYKRGHQGRTWHVWGKLTQFLSSRFSDRELLSQLFVGLAWGNIWLWYKVFQQKCPSSLLERQATGAFLLKHPVNAQVDF